LVGSLGVVCSWTDDSQKREKEGLKDYEVVSSQSPNKRLAPNSKEGKAALQKELDEFADIFIESVAQNRGKSKDYVEENFGKGGLFLAQTALEVGMIDGIGNLEGIINKLSKGDSFMDEDEAKKEKAVFAALASKAEDNKPKDEDEEEDSSKAKKATKAEDSKPEEEDDEEKEEEEEEEDAKDGNKKKAALLASNPKLYNAIKAEGVMKERARIKAILDIADSCGYSDLVKKALVENPISAQNLALQIIKANKTGQSDLLAAFKADADALNGVSASSGVDSGEENYKESVNAIAQGLKMNGYKEVKI